MRLIQSFFHKKREFRNIVDCKTENTNFITNLITYVLDDTKNKKIKYLNEVNSGTDISKKIKEINVELKSCRTQIMKNIEYANNLLNKEVMR